MIKLRRFFERDIGPITEHANNSNISRYMTHRMPYPYTADDAKWWVETGCKQSGLYLAVDLAGECVGVVGVRFGQHETQYSAEIGYWIAERHWGKGIGSDAVANMTDRTFSESNIVRLCAPVFSPNKASMKVLQNCGYSLEAIHRRAIFKNDEFMDEHVFVKFRS